MGLLDYYNFIKDEDREKVYKLDEEIYELQGNLMNSIDIVKLQELYSKRSSIIMNYCNVIQE